MKKINRSKIKSTIQSTMNSKFKLNTLEKSFLLAALFCFSFGLGLISDGNRLYSQQLKISQRVDYHSTQNGYPQN